MKIFSVYYTRHIPHMKNLEELCNMLAPWVEEVSEKLNPFLQTVAANLLRRQSNLGGIFTPWPIKNALVTEILRLNSNEDLQSIINLAIIISYREYNPCKGNCDMANWLSWRIPFKVSQLVTWRVTRPIGPFDELVEMEDPPFDRSKESAQAIIKEFRLSKCEKDHLYRDRKRKK